MAQVLDESVYREIIRYAFYIIGVVTGLGIGETLRRLIRMEKKQDSQVETHNQCRMTLMSKSEFNDWHVKVFIPWQHGRDGPGGLWQTLNHHSHVGIDGEGKVIK